MVPLGEIISEEYSLEYGKDVMEMHVCAVQAGERALIVDDLVATGGTLFAAIRLLGSTQNHIFILIYIQMLNACFSSYILLFHTAAVLAVEMCKDSCCCSVQKYRNNSCFCCFEREKQQLCLKCTDDSCLN